MQPYYRDILAGEGNKTSKEISNNCVAASLEPFHVVVKDSLDSSLHHKSYTELDKCIPGALLEYLLILIITPLGNKNCHRFK